MKTVTLGLALLMSTAVLADFDQVDPLTGREIVKIIEPRADGAYIAYGGNGPEEFYRKSDLNGVCKYLGLGNYVEGTKITSNLGSVQEGNAVVIGNDGIILGISPNKYTFQIYALSCLQAPTPQPAPTPLPAPAPEPAWVDIGEATNKKSDERIIATYDTANFKMKFEYESHGVKEHIKTLELKKLSDGIELKGKSYSMNIIKATTEASGYIFEGLGATAFNINEECEMPIMCNLLFTVPVGAVLFPIGVATFVAGLVTTPIDGSITLFSAILGKKSIAKRKFNEMTKGDGEAEMNNRAFQELVAEIKSL